MNASGFRENAVGGQSHELYIPKNNIPYRAPQLHNSNDRQFALHFSFCIVPHSSFGNICTMTDS